MSNSTLFLAGAATAAVAWTVTRLASEAWFRRRTRRTLGRLSRLDRDRPG